MRALQGNRRRESRRICSPPTSLHLSAMAELTVVSFNTHWGVDRRGRPFDVAGTCLALEPDVLVLQEAWRPHGATNYVDELVDRLGAVVHETVFMSDRNPARPRHLHLPPGP